ncbi:hypothetical protein WG66_010030 [Moniliophthora roreri]|nr:hypothetical protein WG66_010030 [Moniliophthora roreri]
MLYLRHDLDNRTQKTQIIPTLNICFERGLENPHLPHAASSLSWLPRANGYTAATDMLPARRKLNP